MDQNENKANSLLIFLLGTVSLLSFFMSLTLIIYFYSNQYASNSFIQDWGSLIGGLGGALIAIFGVWATIRNNRILSREEIRLRVKPFFTLFVSPEIKNKPVTSKEALKEKWKESNAIAPFYIDDAKLVRPKIDSHDSINAFFNNFERDSVTKGKKRKAGSCSFKLKNSGVGVAADCVVALICKSNPDLEEKILLYSINPEEDINILFFHFEGLENSYKLELSIDYKDIYENKYFQSLNLVLKTNGTVEIINRSW